MKLTALKLKLKSVDVVPAGWRTTRQWAKYWGLSYPHAFRLLLEARGNGLCASKDFRIFSERGMLRPTPHYKFKEAA